MRWIYSILVALVAVGARAQEFRTGRLENGLTYYIMCNRQTPGAADFYFAQRVGSILEEPQQRGLAHFLEHMAFNGTDHFKGNLNGGGIVPWCESVGIKFGANLNASTNVDQTIYNLSAVPTARTGVQDTVLLIFRDWSCGLLLRDDEIEKERGVINEEWRTRRTGMATQRMVEPAYAEVYAGSRYADCLPIGSMEVVMNFRPETLRDYYRRWYRPDLQAVIVVGDINVERTERKIRELFGPIPLVADAPERVYYPVNVNEGTVVTMQKDSGQPTFNISLYFKSPATPDSLKGTPQHLRDGFIKTAVAQMLDERLKTVTDDADCPAVSASARAGQFLVSRTCDAIATNVVGKRGKTLESITLLATEAERACRHGFTAPELDRAKQTYLAQLEKAAREEGTRKNSGYVRDALRNFLYFEPLYTQTQIWQEMSEIVADVTLDEVNAAARALLGHDNRAMIMYCPDKEDEPLPTKAEVLAALQAPWDMELGNWELEAGDTELVIDEPAAGSIVSERPWGDYGVTELTLSNGVRVYVKPTDFTASQVRMRLFSPGGTSQYANDELDNISYITRGVLAAGVANLDAKALNTWLTSRSMRLSPSIGETQEAVNGRCSAPELADMLRLTYAYFTSPRVSERDFRTFMSRQESFIANRGVSDKVTYNDSLRSILYGDDPRLRPMTVERLPNVDYGRCLEMYRERFADASDFTMLIVGNVSLDTLKPLLCKYIASLPSTGRVEAPVDRGVRMRRAEERHFWTRPMETPTTKVNVYLTADVEVTSRNDVVLDILCQALRTRYTEEVREEKGGTYGVSVGFETDTWPVSEATMTIAFNTAPEKYAELMPLIYSILDDMATAGPSAEVMEKITAFLLKNYEQNQTNDGYWDYVLYNLLRDGVDYHAGYQEIVRSVTAEEVRAMATRLLANGHLEVTMSSQ